MKAIRIEAFGDPAEVVKAVDLPDAGAPAASEVVIALEASPIGSKGSIRKEKTWSKKPRQVLRKLIPLIQKVLASKPPIAELIGFSVEQIGEGRAVAFLQSGPRHANPMGTLHGGVLCDVADAAMGMAFASTLAPGESFTTMGLAINFFRPVWRTRLRAKARVINRGKNVGYVECEVTDKDGKQVSKANSNCFVLRGEHARER